MNRARPKELTRRKKEWMTKTGRSRPATFTFSATYISLFSHLCKITTDLIVDTQTLCSSMCFINDVHSQENDNCSHLDPGFDIDKELAYFRLCRAESNLVFELICPRQHRVRSHHIVQLFAINEEKEGSQEGGEELETRSYGTVYALTTTTVRQMARVQLLCCSYFSLYHVETALSMAKKNILNISPIRPMTGTKRENSDQTAGTR